MLRVVTCGVRSSVVVTCRYKGFFADGSFCGWVTTCVVVHVAVCKAGRCHLWSLHCRSLYMPSYMSAHKVLDDGADAGDQPWQRPDMAAEPGFSSVGGIFSPKNVFSRGGGSSKQFAP